MPAKKKNKENLSEKRLIPKDNLLKATDSATLVNSLLGTSNGSINSCRKSEGKRKSLPFLSDSQDNNIDDEIDHEVTNNEEKEEIRNAKVNEKAVVEIKTAEKVDEKTRSYLYEQLTPEQLEAHYSQCITLFSKNKVNAKNAFKLQLIDCMKVFVDKKSAKSENLALMSCTLDASAKIYSCRVDNVYTNMIKFVKTARTGGDKQEKGEDSPTKGSDDEAASDEEDGDLVKPSKKKKEDKRNSLKTFVKEPDFFNRKEVEICYYRLNLPWSQSYFLESPILDESHELTINRPLFANYVPTNATSVYTLDSVFTGEMYRDNLENKIPGYKDIKNKLYIADDGPQEESQQIENSFTFDASIASNAEMQPFREINEETSLENEKGDVDEIEMDYDDCDNVADDCGAYMSTCGDSQSVHPSSTVPTSRVSFTPIAMSRMLRSATSKHSDYSYFDDSKLAFMPSASHWKIKSARKSISAVKTPAKPRRGKTLYLDFTSEDQIRSALKSITEDNKLTHKLGVKTTRDWFYNKTNLIFMPIIANVRKHLLSFFKDGETCVLKTVLHNGSSVNNGLCDVNDSMLLNPLDFSAGDASVDGDDDHHNFVHEDQENWGENMNDVEQHPGEENKTSDEASKSENTDKSATLEAQNFASDSLVPAPNRVESVAVKFSKTQKRIDIKKLKLAIWNLVDLDKNTENKENEEEEEDGARMNGVKKEVKYSDIYTRIPEMISKEAATELSFPIAFMAILHIANEKTLRLGGNENHTDFTVSLDT